jgi:hypothetical protein
MNRVPKVALPNGSHHQEKAHGSNKARRFKAGLRGNGSGEAA